MQGLHPQNASPREHLRRGLPLGTWKVTTLMSLALWLVCLCSRGGVPICHLPAGDVSPCVPDVSDASAAGRVLSKVAALCQMEQIRPLGAP